MTVGSEMAALIHVASAQRRSVVERRGRVLARHEQHLIEAEVSATRGRLVRLARHSAGLRPGYLDPYFLAVADRSTVGRAVVEGALHLKGIAAVDFQVFDPRGDILRIEADEGFPGAFLGHFQILGTDQRTACVAAWRHRRPVLVDDVEGSDLFAGSPGVEVMLAAGSRAVYSYPLLSPAGRGLGVLSFHARRPVELQQQLALVARGAATALASLN